MPAAARISLAFLIVGICSIVASFVWQQDLKFNRGYTEEEALEYAAASAGLHDATHESSHNHEESNDHESVDVAAAQARFDAAQARRDKALKSRALTAGLLKWGGLAITVVSAAGRWLKRE